MTNLLTPLWDAYLKTYLDEATYAQVKDLHFDYLCQVYNLNALSLFDTTFLHVTHVMNAAHDIPHIYREIAWVTRRRMTLALLGFAPKIENPHIANQLLKSRTLADRSRDVAKDLSLLYDFYGYLQAYEQDKLTQNQVTQFEKILHEYGLPHLFAGIGKTRRQQENHTWIWRDKDPIA